MQSFDLRLRGLSVLGSFLALSCVVTIHPVPAAAQEDQEQDWDEWTPELSMKYHRIEDVALSPDGRTVAFTVTRPLMEGEQSEFLTHVWVVEEEGTARQFTRGEESATSPAFSPDGRWLAFLSSREGEEDQVWVMAVNGGEAFRVTDAEAGVSSFQWSPESDRIAYVMRDPETEEETEAEEEKRDVILVDQEFKYAHLYLVPFEPGTSEIPEETRLTEGSFHVTDFDWSPDGERLVFSHQEDPRINTGTFSGDISVVSASGGSPTALVTGEGVERSPRYSPDGTRIAYLSTGEAPEPIGLADVYVIPSDGGDATKLAESPDRRPLGLLEWSGDGSDVFIHETIGTTRHIIALPADGRDYRIVTSGEGVVDEAALDEDADRIAFTWETTDTPEDVYLSAIESFPGTRLTRIHAEVPRPPMGGTELVSWQSSEDGRTIEGLLTYPVDYDEQRAYPLILLVHGGPSGVFLQSFTGAPGGYMLQYFAEQGYAVLRPNPRGSTGYGKEFRYANHQDWGYGDFQDLMSGVDQVLEMGVAHPDSLTIAGWSYGGYMTSWAVTQTDRFQAASVGAGLPNLVSMVTTSDIQDYLAEHMGVEFWEDYERYERHSPQYHIANVTTPTQVLHGAEDVRVPLTQGQEFYRGLDRLGVPTEMVIYPRTPHGPREPKLIMDVSRRVLSWFEEHLREPETIAATPD